MIFIDTIHVLLKAQININFLHDAIYQFLFYCLKYFLTPARKTLHMVSNIKVKKSFIFYFNVAMNKIES